MFEGIKKFVRGALSLDGKARAHQATIQAQLTADAISSGPPVLRPTKRYASVKERIQVRRQHNANARFNQKRFGMSRKRAKMINHPALTA